MLLGEETREGADQQEEFCCAGGEGGGFLVLPSTLVAGVFQQLEEGEMHVLAVGVFVLHDVGYGFVSGEEGDEVAVRSDPVVERNEGAGAETEVFVAETAAVVAEAEVAGGDGEMAVTDSYMRIARTKAVAEKA